MSGKKYAAPLRLEPEPSRRLAFIAGLSVFGAILWPFTVPVPPVGRVIALLLTAICAYRVYRNHFGSKRIVLAVWDENGEWRLRLADGTEWETHLAGDSFVTPEAMILNFHSSRRRFHLVVLADVAHPDILRRLRVRLRLEGAKSANADSGLGSP